jgi:uncharacterized spore protein YtfJ
MNKDILILIDEIERIADLHNKGLFYKPLLPSIMQRVYKIKDVIKKEEKGSTTSYRIQMDDYKPRR